jgi:[ribosomal protein S18]-alanine N-acetyltransferase
MWVFMHELRVRVRRRTMLGMDVTSPWLLRSARHDDAAAIALLSRDAIETGLPWRWRARRVLHAIADPHTNVVVSWRGAMLAGFGIMRYREDDAHLHLLAVHERYRGAGLGSALLSWLEEPARLAGLRAVVVESRADRPYVRSFYERNGYCVIAQLPGHYEERVGALLLRRWLNATTSV